MEEVMMGLRLVVPWSLRDGLLGLRPPSIYPVSRFRTYWEPGTPSADCQQNLPQGLE